VPTAKKTAMGKYFFLLILFIFQFESGAAQTTDGDSQSISIAVQATVLSAIEVTTIRDITFSNVQRSQQEVYVSPKLSDSAGKMVASGIPNATVQINFQPRLQLVHIQSGEPLEFSYDVAASAEDNQSSSQILEPSSRELQLNENGELYIWVGGRVNINNAKNGAYEGQFSIEITYI
jgi:hypothetical protein